MEKSDIIRNVLPEEPSKAELLQFMDTYETTRTAESAYKWLAGKSLLEPQQQTQEPAPREGAETSKSTKTTRVTGNGTMNLWEVLLNLAKIGERAGFSIDSSIQSEKIVFVIGNIPGDKAAKLIQKLLVLIFARLSCVEFHITQTKNSTTAKISMN